MDRHSFLGLFVRLVTIFSTPFASLANVDRKYQKAKGIKVESGADRFGKPMTLFGSDIFYCKVSASDTEGGLYIFESTRIDEGGPALHYHYAQDEWWYILSGEFLIKIGDETYHAKAGDSVFGPRGTPHTFSKVGPGEARLIILFQPAGKMEAWFKAVSDGTVGRMSEEERQEARKAHGFEQVGPPINVLKKP